VKKSILQTEFDFDGFFLRVWISSIQQILCVYRTTRC